MRFIEGLHQFPCRVPHRVHQSLTTLLWRRVLLPLWPWSSLPGTGCYRDPPLVSFPLGGPPPQVASVGAAARGAASGQICKAGTFGVMGRMQAGDTPPTGPQHHRGTVCCREGEDACGMCGQEDLCPLSWHRELAGDGREQDAARTFGAAHRVNAQHHHADEVTQGHEAMSPWLQLCWSTAGQALSLGVRGGCRSPLALVWFCGKHLGHPSSGPCLQWVWAGAEPPQGAHGTEDTWPPCPLPPTLDSEAGALVVQPADLREAAVPAVRVPAGTSPCQSPPPPTTAAAAGAATAGAATAAPVLIDGDLDLSTAKDQPWDASAIASLPVSPHPSPSSPLIPEDTTLMPRSRGSVSSSPRGA